MLHGHYLKDHSWRVPVCTLTSSSYLVSTLLGLSVGSHECLLSPSSSSHNFYSSFLTEFNGHSWGMFSLILSGNVKSPHYILSTPKPAHTFVGTRTEVWVILCHNCPFTWLPSPCLVSSLLPSDLSSRIPSPAKFSDLPACGSSPRDLHVSLPLQRLPERQSTLIYLNIWLKPLFPVNP